VIFVFFRFWKNAVFSFFSVEPSRRKEGTAFSYIFTGSGCKKRRSKEFCMLKKRLFGMMALLVGVMLVFALIGCDTGTNGDGGGGGLSQAEKTAALEEYADDPEGFADFVAGMNSLKGWNLPSNPNTWSASQWEQYYSFIAEYQNGNGGGNDTSPEWPVVSEISSLIGWNSSKITELMSATTWGRATEILEYANVNALVNAVIARLEATEAPVAGIYEYQNGNSTPLNPITAATPFNYTSGRIIVVWE
jgi:hypothetical protein